MKKIAILFVVVALVGSAFTFVQSTGWKSSTDNYSVSFKGDKIEGVFKGLTSKVTIDQEHPEKSKISASIDAKTVNTGNGMMNKHAQSSDALDTKKYGTISFESTSVVKKDGKFEATGKLTLKGVTKTITILFAFDEKSDQAQLSGSFIVNTKDYGISRNGTPEKITIKLDIAYKH